MRNILIIVFIILPICGSTCVCFEIPNVKTAYKQAEVVLSVRVLQVLPRPDDTVYRRINDTLVRVRQLLGFDKKVLVQSIYKGQHIKDTIIIKGNRSNCEKHLLVRNEYIIYGWWEDGMIATNQCTRSALLKNNPDLPYLEKRKKGRRK